VARSALVVGATGLVGGHVVDLLLESAACAHVLVLARRPLGKKHDKLEVRVVDFDALSSLPAVDDVYACLGTTMRVAGTKERFRKVDHDYTLYVARRAREASATRLALVSSVGASERATSFYLRVKGDTERDVLALGFETTVLARPSFLTGDRSHKRFGESAGIAVASALSWAMVGPTRRYRPIEGRTVAAAMIGALARGEPGAHVLEHGELLAAAHAVA
jgi:uncharacterized protein YbjT (DUF2867 family)